MKTQFVECRTGGGSGVRGRKVFIDVLAICAVENEGREAVIHLYGTKVGIDEDAETFMKRLEAEHGLESVS